MRLFPRTAARRRLAAAVAAAAMGVGAVSVPFANAEDLKDRQREVQKNIKHAQSDLEDSSAQLRNATLRLQAAKASLADARAELDSARAERHAARVRDREMKAKLAEAELRLDDAVADLEAGRADVGVQQDAVVDVINETYQGGNPELLALASLMNAETTADLTRRDEVRDVIIGKETRAYDELRAAEVLLEVRQGEVEAARDEVEVQREAAAEHLVLMQELTEAAVVARERVRGLVDDRRDARQGAVQARKHDRAELAQLRAKEREIKQRIAAAARRAARQNSGFRGNPSALFLRPVPGYVTSPYGYRTHPIYGYYGLHNGTDFHAPCGTPLKAIGAGRVLSAYYSSVYGNRVYVGLGMVNGQYVTAVYNHLASRTVSVGQNVSAGQVVGYSGNTGWSTACHLHFTMMTGGRTVDPMNFL